MPCLQRVTLSLGISWGFPYKSIGFKVYTLKVMPDYVEIKLFPKQGLAQLLLAGLVCAGAGPHI